MAARLRYPEPVPVEEMPSTMSRVEARRVCWEPGDHVAIVKNSRPVGRAKVTVCGADGKAVDVDALLVASLEDRNLGETFAVFFTPRWETAEATGGGHLVAVPLGKESR